MKIEEELKKTGDFDWISKYQIAKIKREYRSILSDKEKKLINISVRQKDKVTSEELEKKIIEYIRQGYANWEIDRELKKQREFNNISLGVNKIGNVRKEYMATLSEKEIDVIEKITNQRLYYARNILLINKIKEGYTEEELANFIHHSTSANYITRIKQQIDIVIKWGIMTQEEIESARENRRNKSENLNASLEKEEDIQL